MLLNGRIKNMTHFWPHAVKREHYAVSGPNLYGVCNRQMDVF